jgi:MFS family permease
MMSKRMLHITPMIIWTAISSSIYGSIIISLMTRAMVSNPKFDTQNHNEEALLAMVMLGIGMILGGWITGGIRDRLGNRICVLTCITFMIIAMTALIWFNENNFFTFLTSYSMCLLFGIQDSGIQCFVNCILGFEFESKILPFSVYRFTQSLFTFVIFLVQARVMDPNQDIE